MVAWKRRCVRHDTTKVLNRNVHVLVGSPLDRYVPPPPEYSLQRECVHDTSTQKAASGRGSPAIGKRRTSRRQAPVHSGWPVKHGRHGSEHVIPSGSRATLRK